MKNQQTMRFALAAAFLLVAAGVLSVPALKATDTPGACVGRCLDAFAAEAHACYDTYSGKGRAFANCLRDAQAKLDACGKSCVNQ